jgi:ATP-dependent Lhr-like helicase
MEARGEIHGGRFVAGFHGEQYALPQAVRQLRAVRKQEARESVTVSAADPLNFAGILTPGERVASNTHLMLAVPPEPTVSLAS